MYINFRTLNKKMKIVKCSIRWIDEILDHLCKARVFLNIDLSKAYHQVAVELSHMQKTTFLTKYRLFEFQVLLFKLVNAPATL